MKKYILLALLFPTFTFASFDVNLKYGMSGNDVSALQDLLVSEECLSTTPTGYFGILTLNGVKCFQAKHKIDPVSGYFGALSRAKANSLVTVAIGASLDAEVEETGTIITPCRSGDLFNMNTGKPCNEVASSTAAIEKEVKELKEEVKRITTPITVTPKPPVLEPFEVDIDLEFGTMGGCAHPDPSIDCSSIFGDVANLYVKIDGDYTNGKIVFYNKEKPNHQPSATLKGESITSAGAFVSDLDYTWVMELTNKYGQKLKKEGSFTFPVYDPFADQK